MGCNRYLSSSVNCIRGLNPFSGSGKLSRVGFARALSVEQLRSNSKEVEIKEYDSGFRISAIPSPGHFSSLGLYVDAGSRYEDDKNSGSSHFLDRIAFKSTEDFTRDELMLIIESKIGSVVAHSSREVILYQVSFFRHNLEEAVRILSQVSLRPNFSASEIEEVKGCIKYELEEIEIKHDLICSELLHKVAFQRDGNVKGIARRTFMEESQIEKMDASILRDYMNSWYTPDRIVLAGVGIDLERLAGLSEKYFHGMKPKSEELRCLQEKLSYNGTYNGGIDIDHLSTLRKSMNPDDLILTHVHMAFEGLSMYDPDAYALAVLSTILGGGGSFSAGGPGKGMYTKLYTTVLNRCSWVENCSAINVSYKDSGLFGIGIAVIPGRKSHSGVISLLCDQFANLSDSISHIDIERAKCQLQSSLLSSLEGKLIEAEDLGRQILYFGTRVPLEEVRNRIKQVTKQDITRVINRVIFNEDIPSPHEYPELSNMKRQLTRGSGRVSLVVRAPLSGNDPLYEAEKVITSYGFKT